MPLSVVSTRPLCVILLLLLQPVVAGNFDLGNPYNLITCYSDSGRCQDRIYYGAIGS